MKSINLIRLLSFAKIKKFSCFLLTFYLFFGVFLIATPNPIYAAASIYLTPASKTLNQGESFSVQVRENSEGEPVNAVQAKIAYDTSKLDAVSIDGSSSAFQIKAQETISLGVVTIARGVNAGEPPVTGDQLVASVHFKAKSSSGSTSVNFTDGTVLVRSTDNANILNGTVGGTYTISAAQANQTNPTSPTTPTNKPASQTTSTSGKDTASPKISDLKVEDVGFDKATVVWRTDENSNSIVEYGVTKDLKISAYDQALTKNHKVALSSNILTIGTQFYFRVRSKDAAGNVGESKISSFRTKGYSVKIKAMDLSGKPLNKAKITLIPEFEEVIADKNGVAFFVDVSPGKHSVNIEIRGQKLASNIEVADTRDKPEEIQPFEVKVAAPATTQGQDFSNLVPIMIVLAVASVLLMAVWFAKGHLFVNKKLASAKAGEDDNSPQELPTNEPPTLSPMENQT